MPTWSIARWRSSVPDCTSGIGIRRPGCSGLFMVVGIVADRSRLQPSRRRLDPRLGLARAPKRASIDAAMPSASSPTCASSNAGSPWSMKRRAGRDAASASSTPAAASASATALPAPPATTFSSTVTSASCSRASFSDELGVERLHEAHVGDRRVELFGRGQRRLQHRAEREDRDAVRRGACPRAGPRPCRRAARASSASIGDARPAPRG